MIKGFLPHLWNGISLSVLFFFPLTMSLVGEGQYFMTWKIKNSIEFISAFFVLSIIYASTLYYLDFIKAKWIKTIALLIVTSIPFLFFSIQLLRQYIGRSKVIFIADNLFTYYGLTFIIGGIIVL